MGKVKVIVFGASGQLGGDLVRALNKKGEDLGFEIEILALTKNQVDVRNKQKVKDVIFSFKPDFVFNATGWNDVDGAEKPENVKDVFELNSFCPLNMALLCGEIGANFVNVSTDYVFDGKKMSPYEEGDEPNPLSIYALSKLFGEILVRKYGKKFIIVRSGGLYGINGSPVSGRAYRNFPEKVIENLISGRKMKVVFDRFSAPTWTFDLARKILEIAFEGFCGLIHIMQIGEISWFDFACEVAKVLKLNVNLIEPVSESEFKTPAQRPKYSVLKNSALEKLGKNDMLEVKEALMRYLKQRRLLT
jgi:dTDP-4-dehydrorhamnose reductase